MLRSVLQLRLEDKFAKTDAKKVRVIAKKLKYKFAGHPIRDQVRKWSGTLTTWIPHMGLRLRGRPLTRL